MIIRGFDEKKYYIIAKESGSKQARDDVKYARLAFYKYPGAEYAERIDDDSYILCYRGLNVFRIIGLATREDMKGKGLAGMLLKRALNFARMGGGYKSVYTYTKDGNGFYQRYGDFRVTEVRNNGEYRLEMRL